MTNRDFSDLFAAFAAAEVRFLVVGAYAVTFHGRARFTKDLDVWVEPSADNAARVWQALAKFGAPLGDLTLADLRNPEMVFQMGMPPNRIDILMGVTGLDFASAWTRRVDGHYEGLPVAYLGRADLIANKRAVGRPQDLSDVRFLEGRED